jgi:hypothetical protein
MKFMPLREIKGRWKEKRIDECYQSLLKSGQSIHSPFGCLGAHMLNRLVREGRAFTLRYIPDGGYHIELNPENDRK